MHKPNMTISRLATPMLIVFGLLASEVPARAQSDRDGAAFESADRHRLCSNRTLSGDYGFAAEGLLIGTPRLPPRAPFRSLGLTHFDSKGNLTWLERTVINGVLVNSDWTAATGTYSINPNCTGTAVVYTPNSPVPLNLALVVVREGKEIRTVLETDAVSTVFIKVE